MVVTAAREAGLSVVAEGGSLYNLDVTLLQDGNTGLEHNMPGERFYDDILQLWTATGVGYTPTLAVTYGGPGAEHLFYQRDDVWRHPLLSRFVPPHVLQPRAVRRIMAPDSDYQPVIDSAANAAALSGRQLRRLFPQATVADLLGGGGPGGGTGEGATPTPPPARLAGRGLWGWFQWPTAALAPRSI